MCQVCAYEKAPCLSYFQGYNCTPNAMDWAAAFGQTDVVRWLTENRTEGCTKDAMGETGGKQHHTPQNKAWGGGGALTSHLL